MMTKDGDVLHMWVAGETLYTTIISVVLGHKNVTSVTPSVAPATNTKKNGVFKQNEIKNSLFLAFIIQNLQSFKCFFFSLLISTYTKHIL